MLRLVIPAFQIADLSGEELIGPKAVLLGVNIIIFMIMAPFVLFIVISNERTEEYIQLVYKQFTTPIEAE
jgi:hypothetical protein